MKTYTTISGDSWDKIALEQLGREYLFPLLLAANQKYRHILIFSSGIVLNIPEFEVKQIEELNRPDWLDEADDEIIEEGTVEVASEEDS